MADTKKVETTSEVETKKATRTRKSSKATAETSTETKKATKKTTKKTEVVEETAPKAKKTTKKKATTEVAAVEEAPKRAKAKKEVAEVAPLKPTVTEAKASGISLKITPRKCRLSCDLVRGKDCYEALAILANTRHKSAQIVSKVIRSAMANAVNNFNMDEDKLYVASIQASDSIKMKRYLPRAKGSASGLVKRFTNLYVVVKERI